MTAWATYSAPSELYGMGVAPFLRFHRRLFTLSHFRGFCWQPEAPAELCLRLKEVVRSCGPAVFNRVPRTAYRRASCLTPHT